MRLHRTLLPLVCLCALVSAASGCGEAPIPVSDVEHATRLLNETLSAWKAGESVAAQRAKNPPIYVAEELWLERLPLASYRIHGSGQLVGTNVRFHVTLGLEDRKGKVTERDLYYLLTTSPAYTMARDD